MIRALVLVTALSAPPAAFAWGGRGHHTICSAAVALVQEQGLRDLLKHRPHTMGHICNIPDIYWKSLPAAVAKEGSPAHYLDPEIAGLALKDVPGDFSVLERDYTGKPNKMKPGATIFSVPNDIGSLWWRADQFHRRAIALKDALAKAVPPKGPAEEQNDALPFNQATYDLIVNLGLMGHFAGDASMPLHTTADHDGWYSGHGGLHSYYEDLVVAELPGDLEAQVIASARKIRKAPWLGDQSIVETMRTFTEETAKDIPKMLAADPVKKKSEVKKDKGMEVRVPAQREAPSVGKKKFEKMIIGQMARSARLLAGFWDRTYAELGRPQLSAYRSYRYPFTPDYVPLDYVAAPKTK